MSLLNSLSNILHMSMIAISVKGEGSSLNMHIFAKEYAAFKHMRWHLIPQTTKSSCLTSSKVHTEHII